MQARLNFFQHGPEAMQAMAGLERRIASSGLEQSLLELVRLRASQINGCAYCIDKHASDALKAGESPRRLVALPAWRETPFFDDRERAALEWTEALTLVATSHVPDDAWASVRSRFQDAELVDLTLAIATVNSWNRFAVAFRKLPA